MSSQPDNLLKPKISNIFDEALQLMDGYKWAINKFFLLTILCALPIFFITFSILVATFQPEVLSAAAQHVSPAPHANPHFTMVAIAVVNAFTMPFMIAGTINALYRAINIKINSPLSAIFSALPSVILLIILYFLIPMVADGALLPIVHSPIPSLLKIIIEIAFKIIFFTIYLAGTFTALLVTTQDYGFIAAIKHAFVNVIKHYKFSLRLALFIIVLTTLSAITLIGWIWLVPIINLMIAIAFRDLFGVKKAESPVNDASTTVELTA